MNAKLSNGMEVFVYWPDQCKLCTGYTFRSTGGSCDNCATQEFIDKLRELERTTNNVWGSLEFKCDYFCLDEEKFKITKPYCDQLVGCCAG